MANDSEGNENGRSPSPHRRWRAWALCCALCLLVLGCSSNQASSSTSQKLAAAQTLTFPLLAANNITTLDPAHVNTEVNHSITDELFGGLLKVDQNLKVVPFIATSLPAVSSDGLTYTFHLHTNAKFWNGDPLTAQDVIYSWSRTAAAQDTFATFFQPVSGYQAVAAGKASVLSGLSAADSHTVVARLEYPAGYWLSELALWPANIVDPTAVQQGGASWWSNPATAVGAGPFRLTQYSANSSSDFAPVKNWWGGSTGTLTHVHLDMGVDPASAVKKYEAGGYDLVGAAGQTPSNDDILRFQSDPTKKAQLHLFKIGLSTWMGFNFTGNSPFAPQPGVQPGQPTQGLGSDQGQQGRAAFSLAINRDQLADVACAKALTCKAATGGYIASGLIGYLGDNSNPGAPAGGDPSKAKADYQKWDPTGSKVQGLKLEYSSSSTNDQVWQNVQAQLKSNLGINVQLYPTDTATARADRDQKKATVFQDGWFADYNHPEEWFDDVFSCTNARISGSNNAGYCDPAMDQIVAKANQEPLTQALTQYQQAQRMMVQNNFGAELYYGNRAWLIQPNVRGAGYTGVADQSWTGIEILQK